MPASTVLIPAHLRLASNYQAARAKPDTVPAYAWAVAPNMMSHMNDRTITHQLKVG
jgi:hypothetical protein